MNKFQLWIYYWISLFEDIISVLTFGDCVPNWSFNFVAWCIMRKMEKKRNANK